MFVKTGYNAYEFLGHPLPDIQYGIPTMSGTNAAHALGPEQIEKWDNFFVPDIVGIPYWMSGRGWPRNSYALYPVLTNM
jgi:hypothetical protein